jgi:hypothetical protein
MEGSSANKAVALSNAVGQLGADEGCAVGWRHGKGEIPTLHGDADARWPHLARDTSFLGLKRALEWVLVGDEGGRVTAIQRSR